MKYLIASDIHGSAYWAERLVAAIESQQPDRIVLLGRPCSITVRATTCRAITPPSA